MLKGAFAAFPTASALALPIDSSSPFYVPTAPASRGFQREDSLISIKQEADEDVLAQAHIRSVTNSNPEAGALNTSISDRKLSMDELRNQVWVFSHGSCPGPSPFHGLEFHGEIHDQQYTPEISRGKARILTAIRSASASTRVKEPWQISKPCQVLTTKSYCARRLHDFFEKKNLPQPAFLEERIVLPIEPRPRSVYGP
jgi:hypothetical protein